jgi:metallo-beta-lactamase family protein
VKTSMLNTIIDLENDLKALRKKVKSAEVDRDIGEEEIDRLKYIQDELKSVFGS